MASWQAYVTTFFTRRLVRARLVGSPDAATIRKVFNASQPSVPRGCEAKRESIGGVAGEWMIAKASAPIGTLLYLHGGAHVACSSITHRPVTSAFAKRGWRVFAPDYRLAPEHRFPAQIDDCVAVYRALLASGVDARQLAVAGDSAGGNLTLALCLALRAAGLPQPAALALFSPVTDFAGTGESTTINSDRCAMFSKDILPIGSGLYLGDHDARDPLASPYYADLTGLPPMLFHVGADEILLDDSVRVAQRAKQVGIEVEIKIWPVVPHAWQIHPWMPEGRDSVLQAHTFLQRHLGRTA
jgi:monoterpene epsilon-lactone hydrolase